MNKTAGKQHFAGINKMVIYPIGPPTKGCEMAERTETINAQGIKIGVVRRGDDDYISLTDIARYKSDEPSAVIANWMRLRDTIDYLGVWERLNNPEFNSLEFEGIEAEAESTVNKYRSPRQVSSKRKGPQAMRTPESWRACCWDRLSIGRRRRDRTHLFSSVVESYPFFARREQVRPKSPFYQPKQL